MKTTEIYTIPFFSGTPEEASSLLLKKLEEGKQTAVFTPNGEILYEAKHDPSYAAVLKSAEVNVPDGVSVLRVARMLGRPLDQKIAGVDLGRSILSKTDRPVFFLGGREGVAGRAAEKLRSEYPALHVAGTHHGFFSDGPETEALLETIRESGAEILFVCLGAPRQEKWVARYRAELPSVRLFLALGGSIDVYAGEAKRAPDWMIRHRLEWLYRILKDPSRISRADRVRKLLRECRKETKKTPKD